MKFALNYVFVLIWLAFLISSGVLLFSRGFLLSRVSKTDVGSCLRLSSNPDDEYFLNEVIAEEIFKDVNATSNLCLPQKTKVIILLIDALKYEFGLYKENLSDPLPHENKLPILSKLLRDAPERARLLRFRADPPTTTLQRLKGITTGSLPTFIDIGSNFATPEINEDNIIDQLMHHNMPVIFMGDETWTDLYPRRFKRFYSYPSFDIFDLDTVDRKIEEHLPVELAKKDWEVLIAHFLGVDHCGHKHGPLHSEMERKLGEMNSMISSVVRKMDDETTLLIMGDHGMTMSGDHGGETEDEVNALLFAYSKRHQFMSAEYGSDNETLQQIDLVPTLATILGIPIPYSNLGMINFNIVPDVHVAHMSKFQTLLLHAWQNAQQIHNYFYNYALENRRTFSIDQLEEIEREFVLLAHRVKTVYNVVAFKSFIHDLQMQLRRVLDTCRDIWIKFDATQMSHGLIVTIVTVFFMFLLVNNMSVTDYARVFNTRRLLYIYLSNFVAAAFGYRFYAHLAFKSPQHGIIFCSTMLSISILGYLTVQNWATIATNWSHMKRFDKLATRIICLITLSIFFSNSFIIEEAKILSFLLVASLMLLAYELLQHSIRQDYKTRFRFSHFLKSATFRLILCTILAIFWLRSASSLFRCREEQNNCNNNNNNIDVANPVVQSGSSCSSSSSSSSSSIVSSSNHRRTTHAETYILSVVIIVLYTTLTRLYLRSCGNLTGGAINVQMARYGPTIASICAGGHILLANSSQKNIQRSHIDAMALIIYALLILQMIVVSLAPLMTYVAKPEQQKLTANQAGIIPELYKRLKRIYEGGSGGEAGSEATQRYKIPIVYGLATVYSSTIISFGLFLALMLIVLLSAKSSLGFVCCIFVGVVLLALNAFHRARTAVNLETCIQPTFTAIVSWFLLAHFTFFATSHQTTLSQIDWRAAFIGRSSGIGSNNFISGILVILNTFCGQIYFMFMYGLLNTETFSIFALFPNLLKTNCNRDLRKAEVNDPRLGPAPARSASEISTECFGFDMTRGELILFENEGVFLGSTFKLAAQFFMMQGIKIFFAMMACTIHCRHLMVWKIFAPRFIYESLATFVILPALILGFVLYVRIHAAVNGLIKEINKRK